MIKESFSAKRLLQEKIYTADLVVIGGGLSGTCCAITAARMGSKVILVQDRPVLGGNASSEIRLWVLGATSHMGNNNRWAREGGVIDELLLENLWRNPEGNPIIFDTILLEKVTDEENITLLLNTAIYEIYREGDQIEQVIGFCSQNSTRYILKAPLFCDASGDGIAAFLSGAAFRMGAESKEEFDEKFAPTTEYGELLGHSLYFYSKDTGRPVKFTAPHFALTDITAIPRFRSFNANEHGCRLWWIEYGGRLDTIHDTETIKWELWKVVYGVWNYIKNSGNFPEATNLTLEWVGTIPGKRESRRFEGDYILSQRDIVEQRVHQDVVAFGGWSIDLHPADGVFSEKPGCNQWHSKGIYGIPYRCLYSRNINNLFLAGRIMSASHVAFGSTRVMGTGAHCAQAIGMAAAYCTKEKILPRALTDRSKMRSLQQELLRYGQHLPNLTLEDSNDLSQQALINASSELILNELPQDGPLEPLVHSAAQMLPLDKGRIPRMSIWVKAEKDTTLRVEFRISSKEQNYTPDVTIQAKEYPVKQGKQRIDLDFDAEMPRSDYGFICVMKNELLSLQYSQLRVSGILSVFNKTNPAVSNYGRQDPIEDIGVEAFEFWTPERRPRGYNLAMSIDPGISTFQPENVRNGVQRPTHQPNAWVAGIDDNTPTLSLSWPEPKLIQTIELYFDSDYDHPLESVLMTHPETSAPFCIKEFKLRADNVQFFHEKSNYLSRKTIKLENPLQTRSLTIELSRVNGHVPAALMEIRCYTHLEPFEIE